MEALKNHITPKKPQGQVPEVSQDFRAIMRFLLGYTNIKPTKKVENFIGQFFEKYFETLLGGKIIDTNGLNPDLEAYIDGTRFLFEIKSANYCNSILLKLNQLERFRLMENCNYIIVFYKCEKPSETYRKLGYDGFLERMTIDSVYVLSPEFLSSLEKENQHLSRRQKLTFMNEPRDELVIKLSKRSIENHASAKGMKIEALPINYVSEKKQILFGGISTLNIYGISDGIADLFGIQRTAE